MNDFLIKKCPSQAYYIPNFITTDEESNLIKSVYEAPKPKWTQLKNRRLQNWGGVPQPKGMIEETIPIWLSQYCDRITNLGVFEKHKPNHILINEYLAGQGIMPHVDGSLYYPTVTTISLGSHTLLDFYEPFQSEDQATEETIQDNSFDNRYKFSLLLEPCSLLVLKDNMYNVLMHGIKETTEDIFDEKVIFNAENLSKNEKFSQSSIMKRDTRISLTIRNVPKIIKINKNLFFKKK